MFVSRAQDNWDDVLPAVEFAYHIEVHDSKGQTPFVLSYGRQLPAPVDYAISDDVPAANDFIGAMRKAFEDAKRKLVRAQQRQKSYADSRCRDVEFQVGKEVLLSTQNLHLKAFWARKLPVRFIGVFAYVARVGDVAYRLVLPGPLRIDDVFRLSFISRYVVGKDYKPPPLPVVANGALKYEVDRVLMHRQSSIK